jgi:hypothetical protein
VAPQTSITFGAFLCYLTLDITKACCRSAFCARWMISKQVGRLQAKNSLGPGKRVLTIYQSWNEWTAIVHLIEE